MLSNPCREPGPARVAALVVAALSVGLVAPAVAGGQSVARIQVRADRVVWWPHVEYDRLVLTVSCPNGDVLREEFRAPRTPEFRPREDGPYVYEVRVIPWVDPDVRERMREARERDATRLVAELREAGLLPEPVPAQSGFFRVLDGSFVESSDE